jgi:hypothetical protein
LNSPEAQRKNLFLLLCVSASLRFTPRIRANSCQNLFPYPVNPVHLVHVLWPFPFAKIRANS